MVRNMFSIPHITVASESDFNKGGCVLQHIEVSFFLSMYKYLFVLKIGYIDFLNILEISLYVIIFKITSYKLLTLD